MLIIPEEFEGNLLLKLILPVLRHFLEGLIDLNGFMWAGKSSPWGRNEEYASVGVQVGNTFVFGMRQEMIMGMMQRIFQMTFPVQPGPAFGALFSLPLFRGEICLDDIAGVGCRDIKQRIKADGQSGFPAGRPDYQRERIGSDNQSVPRKYLYRGAQSRHTQSSVEGQSFQERIHLVKKQELRLEQKRGLISGDSRKPSTWRRRNWNLKKSAQRCNPISINNGQKENVTFIKLPSSTSVYRQQVLLSS